MRAFTGLLAYPITPLSEDGGPDLDGVVELVGRAGAAGVDAVTMLASSGDGRAFDTGERDAVVRSAVAAAGRMPVHVAVSAVGTREVLAHARAAESAGASGLLCAPFAYAPLLDDEVVGLVRAVGTVSALPLCFYNKPVQTQYDVPARVLGELHHSTTLVAVKDPAATAARPGGRVAALHARVPGLVVGLSGDAALAGTAEPADAWHTGLAALLPAEYAAMRRARVAGDPGPDETRSWLASLVAEVLTLRPVPALHVLANLLGVPTAPPRGPWLPATDDQVARLRAVVERRPVG
ncbi:dihydrodipicolinate synthase family protein [Luteimicrobium subarcticum]|uniref:4-hydroxy-tetrahydrodipicolinate synthase n=1 Tax=Luteimicrobium subarcticum TaxID=620910 RepID=A0A2M8W1A2_9MICO|nr:dihydrodipicolinate synthase family protein [Luteimicrobium subarcticum]PJI84707.1 4-hydroxy-tetrahydrodipicolinate synthase [Luteimicrobium subarcticum]